MATSTDYQDCVQVAISLVQSLRQCLLLREKNHSAATVMVKMVEYEGKAAEPYIMRGLNNKEKIVIWESKWSLGTFKQESERIKKKLSEAERLVGRLQVLKAEAAEQELASVQADPNQPAANGACCICLIRPRNTVFVPCGHLDVCDTCAGILEASGVEGKPEGYYLCPICRSQVTHRQKVFGL